MLLDSRDSGAETKKRKLTPILDQIIYGPPSVTWNILGITRDEELEETFFEIPSLNRVIIFKYPNFKVEVSDSAATDFSGKDASLSHDRPVETAIYIPNDEEFPHDGGYAVYLRQKDAEELLQRYVGIAHGDMTEAMARDFKRLTLVDDLPSLDPFLLKTALEREKLSYNPAYLQMKDGEEDNIKSVIRDKVRPIVNKALGADDNDSAKTQRFIDAIWDPTIPEAALFIEAFKIDNKEVGNVFSAWKGVSFYQYQFEENKPQIAEVIRWIKSEQSTPIDHREHRAFLEQQTMFKQQVLKKVLNVLGNINQIFKDFDSCYQKFIEEGDPVAFRNFLITSHYRYWLLGYCCTSLMHTRNIFDRAQNESVRGALRFEQLNDMLTNIDATVSSKASEAKKL
ncbi:hypothetical protein NUH88_20315 [Nisaea acidiphila]|uniref:Uncharacterized protein n=1 Tax=Nisaea acidiphila TaxID=1862145 RepID=A0A9J7ATC2_9PROT|nr:hypothetical protein [Nisaea acidiphila]UUX49729.1 hypothetical protein NUH88_20315 [Nisaea acidiphila]